MAEVIEPGESVTPAPGLLKKEEKNEKIPRISSGVGLMPACTVVSYLSRLKKKMAQRYTPIWDP